MKLTAIQQEILLITRMTKVNYRLMYNSSRELGYASIGTRYAYDINIAEDAPSEEIKGIVLIHEAGHLYLKHTEVKLADEMILIGDILKKNNKSLKDLVRCYGGPMNFLNICMDLEINSKILSLSNVKTMKEFFDICTPDAFNIEVKDNFRDYYEPMIKRMSSDESLYKPDMQDIAQTLTEEDLEQLCDEMIDALSKEGYVSGSEKSQIMGDTIRESTIDKERINLRGHSNSSEATSKITVEKNTQETIRNFLKKIIGVDKSYTPDCIRHYNRGTRDRSNGLLYSSKRLNRNLSNKRKIGVLVDVSGSMYVKSIVAAVSSLKDSLDVIREDSSLVTWDTFLVEEFVISKIPETIRSGGGTNIATGVDYLSSKGFTDIVVYSDFETDMKQLTESKRASHANIYNIIVLPRLSEIGRLVFEYPEYFEGRPYLEVVTA